MPRLLPGVIRLALPSGTTPRYFEFAVTLVDATGEKSVGLYRYVYSSAITAGDLVTDAGDLAALVQAITNAAVSQVRVSVVTEFLPVAVPTPDGNYLSVDTSQKSTFLVNDGETKLLSTAAPIFSMFSADAETIDPGNASYGAWAGGVTTIGTGGAALTGCDEDAQVINGTLGGKFNWRRREGGSTPA